MGGTRVGGRLVEGGAAVWWRARGRLVEGAQPFGGGAQPFGGGLGGRLVGARSRLVGARSRLVGARSRLVGGRRVTSRIFLAAESASFVTVGWTLSEMLSCILDVILGSCSATGPIMAPAAVFTGPDSACEDAQR